GIRVEIVGVIYLFATLLAAAGASLASRFESITGESGFLISIPVIFVFSYLFMGFLHSLVAISFIFAISFFRGTFWPIMSKYLNERIPSERRATIISLASLMYSVIMIPSEPIFGNLADRFSMNTSIIILAVVYGIIASIIVGFWFARCRKSDS
ncbi:MAG: MFS transporter, partial [Theionarchaea archaeon]|nr:MFS transporter [Theionarchaea archaeon]